MNLDALSSQLDEIVADRKTRLPTVAARIGHLNKIRESLAEVDQAVRTLPPDWQSDPIVREAAGRLRDPEIVRSLDSAAALMDAVKARFSRDTINLGVSGRARVGKSLLLQSTSGLDDQQVPTGEGTNVTAVRSRIFHAQQGGATITFHTPQQFIDEIVRPYYEELQISPSPASLRDFKRDSTAEVPGNKSRLQEHFAAASGKEKELGNEAGAKWDRLLEIARALPSLPIGNPVLRLGNLEQLRRYVAYPTTAEKDREERETDYTAPRDYLAVRDCRIDAPFPVTALDRLGLVDLPGLGESASGIDKRIVSSLSGEVDAVLMVFRATTGLANINTIDRRAMDLVTKAQGAVSDSRDFAWIVVNAGPQDQGIGQDLVSELHRDFNHGEPDSKHLVLVADASSPESIHSGVLIKVLDRLAERLVVMDRDVLESAVREMTTPLRQVEAAAKGLSDAITSAKTQSGSARQVLDERAERLLKDLQGSLAQIRTDDLQVRYMSGYLDQLEAIHGETKDWLEGGLGRFGSREEWEEEAAREYGVHLGHGTFAKSELHRLRVEVTQRYAKIDAFLNDAWVEGFYGRVVAAVAGSEEGMPNLAKAHREALLGPDEALPSKRLEELVRNLELCDPSVPTLLRALDGISGLTFDFRLQAYPALHQLVLGMRPVEEDGPNAFPPSFPMQPTRNMYDWFLQRFVQYSLHMKSELKDDAERQLDVLRGALTVLEDGFIRAGDSQADVRNLVDGFRDELWPGEFDEMNSGSAQVNRLKVRTLQLVDAVDQALEADNER